MMKLKIIPSNRFQKDLRLMQKRGLDIDKLKKVISILASGETLDTKYRDHPLSGVYAESRECHIQPDWLLIYRIDGNRLVLLLTRTGSHSDLF